MSTASPVSPASPASRSALPQPGALVGVRYGRWPYAHAHPGCWEAPLVGTVLAVTDPAAWAGRIAFPGAGVPAQADVDAHVAELRARGVWAPEGATPAKVPVRWTHPGVSPSATGEAVVHWEEVASLRSYADDLAAWEAARAAAYAAVDARRPAAHGPAARGARAHLTLVRAA